MTTTPEELVTQVAPPAKVRKLATKKDRASFREKILDKLLKSLDMTPEDMPSPEELFAKQIAAGQEMVPLEKLAVVNDFGTWESNNTELGKAMREIAPEFGERNILNHSAEVDPTRVLVIMQRLLMHRRLIHSVEATIIEGPIPETEAPDGFLRDVAQVWTGRHRVIAFAMLYGPAVKVPLLLDTMSYADAVNNCIESNSVRKRGKTEQLHHEGILESLGGRTAAIQFEEIKTKPRKIANFIAQHTLILRDDLFAPVVIPIREKVSKEYASLTMPNYLNMLSEAISAIGADQFPTLDSTTQAILSAVVETGNIIFETIKQGHPTLASTAWNAYSSGSIGRLIGQAMAKSIASGVDYSADETAFLIAKTVVGYIKHVSTNQDQIVRKSYVRTPTSEHVIMLRKYAQEVGIVLPIVERQFISRQ